MFRAKLEFNTSALVGSRPANDHNFTAHVHVTSFMSEQTGAPNRTRIGFARINCLILDGLSVDVPYEALEVLAEAVNRNQTYLNAEIDLTPEGQKQINFSWRGIAPPKGTDRVVDSVDREEFLRTTLGYSLRRLG